MTRSLNPGAVLLSAAALVGWCSSFPVCAQTNAPPAAPQTATPLTNAAPTGPPDADQRAATPAEKDFTPWMSPADLNNFLKQFDTNPPGGHPNYWDKGHWINAVEGSWHDGIPQYRIAYGPTPAGYHCAWYWYINQLQGSFSGLIHDLSDQGFVLVDPNSYLRPDDVRIYQAVWHRVGSKITDSAPAEVTTNGPAVGNHTPALPAPDEASSNGAAKLKALLERATQAVLIKRDPKDFDAIIGDVATAADQARSGAFGNGTDRQLTYAQIEAASRFLKEWQSYLVDHAVGNVQMSSNDLRNLASNGSSFMPIPRSQLLELAGKEAGQTAPALETEITLNSLDDLPAAIGRFEVMQRGGNYSMEMNGLLNAMQTLQNAYQAYQDKNYSGALQQLANNPMAMMAGVTNSATASAANGNAQQQSLHKKLAELKNGLLVEIVQALLAMPDAAVPQPGETAADYLLRLAASKKDSADWAGLEQVLLVYQQSSGLFSSPAWLHEDLVGLHAYLVANKLEAAGQHLDAIRSYRQALATLGKFFPAKPAATQLSALQKKYPDLYDKALQTPIVPAPPQTPF